MNFLKRLFVRTPEEFIAKGDALLRAGNYFEARNSYESGIDCCRDRPEYARLVEDIRERISEANSALAGRNIEEAGHAERRGDRAKAAEHLELALELAGSPEVREKAARLLAAVRSDMTGPPDVAAAPRGSSCSSCSSSGQPMVTDEPADPHHLGTAELFELLVHQLPEEVQRRYAALGETFAAMFIAASHDRHEEALALLEAWYSGPDRDIYCCEKAKILHRLGKVRESETYFLESIRENVHNPLPHLGLALLLLEEGRLDEAARQTEAMASAGIFAGQATMMRGEVYEMAGDTDGAIALYGRLLDTPLARAAAEKLCGLLNAAGRQDEAAAVFKRYLKKCQH